MIRANNILAFFLTFSTTSSAFAQEPSFGGLGLLPDCTSSFGAGASSGGVYIVGWSSRIVMGTGERLAFVWDSQNGLTALVDGIPGDEVTWNEAYTVSSDGRVITGNTEYDSPTWGRLAEAVRWFDGVPQRLGFLGGDRQESLAEDASEDGSIVVGWSTYDPANPNFVQAFRWHLGTMEALGDLPGGRLISRAMGISADGSVIVGWGLDETDISKACIWQNDTIMSLGTLPGGVYSRANAVSDDGTTIVGISGSSNGDHAFLWRDGTMIDLGPGEARAVSGDGAIVIGESGQAWMWDEAHGQRNLKQVLEDDFNLDLTGWTLTTAWDISADGMTIVGFGNNPDGINEGWVAVVPRDVDTDGDGLLDSWETDGLDINNDGVIDLDLPAMGANPMHKDLFLEVDVMDGVTLDEYAVDSAVDSFRNAPVTNPDNDNGIELHIDMTSADTFPMQEVWDDDFINFGIVKSQYFGTIAERNSSNWEHIRAARRRVFRYCAVVNKIANAGGWGEVPGNDFYIMAGGNVAGDAHWQGVTFIHELGHNLGLDHGGGDEVNHKPNYISVMNYGFHGYQYAETTDALIPDFSGEAIVPLVENNLDETIGITSNDYANVFAYHAMRNPGEAPQSVWVQLNSAQYDWNRDGQVEQGVIVDLNWFADGTPSPGETMNGFNDWPTIVENLPIGTNGPYADGQHVPPSHDEQTYDELQAFLATLPPAPINLASLDDLTIVFGTTLDGDLNDLIASDQQKLKLRSQPGFSAIEPDLIRVVVGATTTIEDPASLGLVFEGRLTHPNGQSRLLLKNWTTNQFVTQSQFNLGFTEEQKFVKDIPAADYVRADDGRIEVAVHQFVVAVFSALGFDAHIDRIEISVIAE